MLNARAGEVCDGLTVVGGCNCDRSHDDDGKVYVLGVNGRCESEVQKKLKSWGNRVYKDTKFAPESQNT